MDSKAAIFNALDFYYEKNPDTLKPLLMASLSTRGYLHVTKTEEKPADALFSLSICDALSFDWVRLNAGLKKLFKGMEILGQLYFNVEIELPEEMRAAYQFVRQYDDCTVPDSHHRLGILDNHSHNKLSEKAHANLAGIQLAQKLIDENNFLLSEKNFIIIANSILERSKIQPARPRLQVAETICAMLKYDGNGTVYNPFSGPGLAAALLKAGERLYADGSMVDSDYVSALLINYGTGGSNTHFVRRDSTQWINWVSPDYVICTYLGYIGEQSAFDFCLSKCFKTFRGKGRMVAMVSPYIVFDNQSQEIKKAAKLNWIESIVVLPFGEVAISIDASRKLSSDASTRFYDCTNPLVKGLSIHSILGSSDYMQSVPVEKVFEPGYLRYLIAPEIHETEGCEIVRIGDLVSPLTRKVFDIDPTEEMIMVYNDLSKPYDQLCFWENRLVRQVVKEMHEPAYELEGKCLVINSSGCPEPQCFEGDYGKSYFSEGYAFAFKDDDESWLIDELRSDYVVRQLHPYGYDSMVPTPFSIEQFLNIQVFRKRSVFSGFDDDSINSELAPKTEIRNEEMLYTIIKKVGRGGFGITYLANETNLNTGTSRKVAIKELFVDGMCHRDGIKVVLDFEGFDDDFEEAKAKFITEAHLMMDLGNDPENHIVHADRVFVSEETDTAYFVMDYYSNGTLHDMIEGDQIPPENVVVDHILIPVCSALKTVHSHEINHLDIKPENILIDDNGFASLSDFGISKQYDEQGREMMRENPGNTRAFAPLEQKHGELTTFAPEADIYALAGTLYFTFTRKLPRPIYERSGVTLSLMEKDLGHVSDRMRNAIILGLQASANLRPKSIDEFQTLIMG